MNKTKRETAISHKSSISIKDTAAIRIKRLQERSSGIGTLACLFNAL